MDIICNSLMIILILKISVNILIYLLRRIIILFYLTNSINLKPINNCANFIFVF